MEETENRIPQAVSTSAQPLPGRLVSMAQAAVLDWPVWWKEQTLAARVLPGAGVLAYWTVINALKGFRPDHLNIGLGFLALFYGGRIARVLLRFLAPFMIAGVAYDSMRFYADYIRGAIHVTQPYLFDKYFFGIHTASGVLTPNEFWQQHTFPILDLITGFAYLVFILEFVLISGYFHFVLARKGTAKLSATEISARSQRMRWSFLWVNLIGWSTYYWYAAAPPWYVAQYGLGPARMDVQASSAGCIRFDHLLGTHFFSEMYGRAADVFGAIPSLHVAYPFLAVYYAFQFGSLRLLSVSFYLLMCFSAVYLNHHYILDILWGTSYAILVAATWDFLSKRNLERKKSLP